MMLYRLGELFDILIKAAIATIISCVAYVYVRTIKDPDYRVNLSFLFHL